MSKSICLFLKSSLMIIGLFAFMNNLLRAKEAELSETTEAAKKIEKIIGHNSKMITPSTSQYCDTNNELITLENKNPPTSTTTIPPLPISPSAGSKGRTSQGQETLNGNK